MSGEGGPGAVYAAGLPASLELPAGGEVRLPLLSAAGAGYVWQAGFVSGDPAAAEMRIEAGPPPRQTDPPTNQPSPVTLVVRAAHAGTACWRLALIRPWQPGSPLVDRRLEITVR